MIQNHCLKGVHMTLLVNSLIVSGGTFEDFTIKKARNRDICLICNKSAYATSQMCPLKQLCARSHGSRGTWESLVRAGAQVCPNVCHCLVLWIPKAVQYNEERFPLNLSLLTSLSSALAIRPGLIMITWYQGPYSQNGMMIMSLMKWSTFFVQPFTLMCLFCASLKCGFFSKLSGFKLLPDGWVSMRL